MKLWIIASGGVAALVVAIIFVSFPSQAVSDVVASEEDNSSPLVPLEKIVSGGPPKDGIPSIDSPKFVSTEKATFMQDGDMVVGLQHNGILKAYPLKILVWHEIVNDSIGDLPVAVTYCPLCFTNMVFERTIDGHVVEFGTSGKLYNSNLVMYDRLSESYWSQAMGKGIVGKYSGYELKRVPFDLALWKEWKEIYPNTLVLSTDTGSTRPYGADPYGDYYTTPQIYFPVAHRDDRLGPKELVMGLEHNNSYKAYKLSDIESQQVINDSVGEKEVMLLSLYSFMARAYDRTLEGKILEFQIIDNKLIDKETGSEWNFEGRAVSGPLEGKQLSRLPVDPSFWFSWVAFHPDTKLYPNI
ncbi:MAG: DUF3179 domain-containing protein [Nitrososphaerales archaeon]